MKTKILKTIFVAGIIIILNIPLLMMVNISLKDYSETLIWPITWFQPPFRWENYYEVTLGEYSIIRPLLNSFIVSFTTMVISTLVSILTAYTSVRYRFYGKRVFLYLIIFLQMFSPVLLSVPLYTLFYRFNLLDTRLSLIIANTASSLPMTIWLLYSYFLKVPWQLEEAAMVDGCSRFQAVKHVIAPIAAPGILTASVFSFIAAWGDLIFARTSIVSDSLQTMPLALVNFQELYITQWQLQLAASTISTLPVFFLFLVIQNHLALGFTNSGNKE